MHMTLRALLATLVLIAIVGCKQQTTRSAEATAPPADAAARPAPSASPIPMTAPPGMGMASPHGASPHDMPPAADDPAPDAKDPAVEKLVAQARTAEAAAKASPADVRAKAAAAEALFKAGHEMMVSAKLNRKSKYRGALKLFRTALVLDPKHSKAAEEKQLIETIYRQMGRPIPQ